MSMKQLKWWRMAPNLILWFMPVATAISQDLPDPLPILPPATTSAARAPVMTARPALVGQTCGPAPVDPAALARHGPKFVAQKSQSFHWRWLQGNAFGYPEEFVPRPLGASLYEHGRTMVANGEAARLTLYSYDFVQGTDKLNPRGFDQLAKHAARLAEVPYPLIIEPTPGQPGLAESRRLTILNATANWPFPLAPDRVLIAKPMSRGLSGIDAQIISANGMDRTAKYGPPIPINSIGVNSPSGVTGQ